MPINKEHLREIFEEVKENNRKLFNCTGPHKFVVMGTEEIINKKYRCELCGGTIDAGRKHWYDQGLKHGMQLNVKEERNR